METSVTRPAFIRSGGQSGVDWAALDTARKYGIRICGWCPRGGWAEDFPEPPGVLALYPELQETPAREPEQRTVWNVRDADATLIIRPVGSRSAGMDATNLSGSVAPQGTDLTARRVSAGTDLTEKTAVEQGKPYMIISSEEDVPEAVRWLQSLPGETDLNIAGPRASEWPDAYETTCEYLSLIFEAL